MPAAKVRSDFEGLQTVSGQFKSRADTIRQTTKSLKERMNTLHGGDWVGKGATKFYSEMNSSVLPSLGRLSTALDSASRITIKISQIMKQAEDDSAALFKGGEAGGHSSGDGHNHSHNKEGGDSAKAFGFGGAAEVGGLFGGMADKMAGMLGFDTNAEEAGRALGKTVNNQLDTDPRAQAVNQFMLAGDKQGAIDEAIRQYDIDVSGLGGYPKYSSELDIDGKTHEDGSIEIGDSAFNSPGWLASTIGHESVHARQWQEGRWYSDEAGTGLNELEAYDYELAQAEAHGLSTAEIEAVRARRAEALEALPGDMKLRRVESGYTGYEMQ